VADLSDPIDVYSEWIDQTEKVNADVAKGHTNEDEYEEDEEELGARGRADSD
jgi:transcription elongation factor Elf1